MALLPPRVIGPLSVCSTGVRVQGQLTGSTVSVFANAGLVAQGIASGPDQVFPLNPGASLGAGQQVSATQTVGLDTSVPSPETVGVQAKPPTIGPVAFVSNLNECGRCLWIEGLVPGAEIDVRASGGPSLAHGSSYDGVARVHLNPPLAAGMTVEAQQTACGTPGAVTTGPPVDPIREQRTLPTPIVESPLRECQHTVTVSNVVHGATVTLLRSAGPNLSGCFDLGSLYFWVNPPLALGETVSARQEFPDCKVKSADATPVIVEDNTPVPAVGVTPPLCAGSTTVTVTGLSLGNRVRILQDGVEIGEAEAPVNGTFDFLVPPLTGGTMITAIQEMCGEWSGPGAAVLVDKAPSSLPTPKVQDPLFECAAVVRVSNLHPGSRVYVFSTLLGAPIGEKQTYATETDVSVAPLLIKGDRIFAVQRGCGLVSSKSAEVEVRAVRELPPPKVAKPLYSCESIVRVDNVVPGARVDVYVNGIFRGTEKTGGTTAFVPVSGTLNVGDSVTARQRLCSIVSTFSQPVSVEEFQGRWRRVGNDTAAGILAVHAALLRTGKIVYFGGDQHTSSLNTSGDVDHTRLFDCGAETVSVVTGLPGNADLFCSGHALLADGRLLAGGGTGNWGGGGIHPPGHFIGIRDTYIFDPADEKWHVTGKMVTQRAAEVASDKDIEKTGGRWYPTLLTLPDGRVAASSGHPQVDDSRHNNNSLELYDAGAGTWSIVGSADYANIDSVAARQYEYPRMHVLPDGTVISTSTMTNGNLEKWHPYTDATDWDHVIGPAPDPMYGGFAQDTTSVLLPLKPSDKYRARILLAGASTPYVLDMGALASGWQATARTMVDYPATGDVNPRRENLDAVMLPTGEVFIEGGVKDPNDDSTAVKRGELFNPDTLAWKVLPEAERARQYHSVSLLMPSGAVWVAGSNFNASTGLANRELRIEIFEPWYFCGRRPVITEAAPKACHGEEFEIRTPDATTIGKVVLVRCGTVTHNFNPDQRHITLEFRRGTGDLLIAKVPYEPNVAIVGYYLLFVIDRATGRPSVAKFIQICPGKKRRRIWDDDFWKWLVELAVSKARPDAEDIRAIQRAAMEETAPPRRRLDPPMRPHGEHDDGGGHPGGGGHHPGGGGHDPGHGGHNHGGGGDRRWPRSRRRSARTASGTTSPSRLQRREPATSTRRATIPARLMDEAPRDSTGRCSRTTIAMKRHTIIRPVLAGPRCFNRPTTTPWA